MKAAKFNHFIDLDLLNKETVLAILRQGHIFKKQARMRLDILKDKTLALIFEKPSTRTRISFELAMRELGGDVIALTGKEMQLGQGESLADTARVMSRFIHGMMVRTYAHDNLLELAKHAHVPVINGLTDHSHPCQVMADLMTIEERLHRLHDITVAWCGDGDNNVLNSWMQAAGLLGFEIRIAAAAPYTPLPKLLAHYQSKAKITLCSSIAETVTDAHVVVTDTWVSMHHTDGEVRRATLKDYQVNDDVMGMARPDAIFMHCLPAHRGEEVTSSVMDGLQSAVWDEAENRLHIQKAILMYCFNILQH